MVKKWLGYCLSRGIQKIMLMMKIMQKKINSECGEGQFIEPYKWRFLKKQIILF